MLENIDILCLQETFIAEPDSTWKTESYMNYYNCFRDVISGIEIVAFSIFYLLQFYL